MRPTGPRGKDGNGGSTGNSNSRLEQSSFLGQLVDHGMVNLRVSGDGGFQWNQMSITP